MEHVPHGLRVTVSQSGSPVTDVMLWRRRGVQRVGGGVPTPYGRPLCVVRWVAPGRVQLDPGFEGAPAGTLGPGGCRRWEGPHQVRVDLRMVARQRAPRASKSAGGDVVFVTSLVSLLVLVGQLRIVGDLWFPDLQTSLDTPPAIVGGWTDGGGVRWEPMPPAPAPPQVQRVGRVVPPVLAYVRLPIVTRAPIHGLKAGTSSGYDADAPVLTRTGVSPEVSLQQDMSRSSHYWLMRFSPRFASLLPPGVQGWLGCAQASGDALIQGVWRLLGALGEHRRAVCPGK